MSLDVHINPSTGTATVTIAGTVTLDTMQQAFARVLDHADFRESSDVLWDLRAAEIPDAASEDMLRLISFIEGKKHERGSGYRVAIVVSSNYHHGLARMYQAYAETLPVDLMVFRDLDEAGEWLGVDTA